MYPQLKMLIDGVWEESPQSGRLEVLNPFDDSVLGELPMIDSEGLAKTVDSARRGFDIWSQMTPIERASILRRGAASIRAQEEEIARVITLE